MKRKLSGQRGMSLVEATIILMVLAILTAVIAPAMTDYVDDAKDMKVKEDVEALGISIARLLRDTGFTGLKVTDGTGALTLVNRVDVLQSSGSVPTFTGATFAAAGNITTSPLQWNTAAQTADFDDQLVRNNLGTTPYAVPSGPGRAKGWRGAYINFKMGADPWGNRYYSNTVFLSVATTATAGSGEGQASGVWTKDVIVVSAGRDNIMQTPIASADGGTFVSGGSDDVIYVLQGNSR